MLLKEHAPSIPPASALLHRNRCTVASGKRSGFNCTNRSLYLKRSRPAVRAGRNVRRIRNTRKRPQDRHQDRPFRSGLCRDGRIAYRPEGLRASRFAAGAGVGVTAGPIFTVQPVANANRNELQLMRCATPCRRPTSRTIWSSADARTLDHPAPAIAVDYAGGIHVAFSDGYNVFLTSSADDGGRWTEPIQVKIASLPRKQRQHLFSSRGTPAE